MAHAVWGAVSSQMSGGSAAAGAAGAFSGELATRYIAEKYWGADPPEKIAALGQEDREQLSLLGTLAAGLAGGMVGNSSAAATSGAVAGKNAVENSYLSSTDKSRQTELNHKKSLTPQEQQQRDALNRKDAETSQTLISACMGGVRKPVTPRVRMRWRNRAPTRTWAIRIRRKHRQVISRYSSYLTAPAWKRSRRRSCTAVLLQRMCVPA